jgi:hypothetical protein
MENIARGAVGYESPEVVDYGDLKELTAQHQSGDFTDQDFPTHTPKSALTFS